MTVPGACSCTQYCGGFAFVQLCAYTTTGKATTMAKTKNFSARSHLMVLSSSGVGQSTVGRCSLSPSSREGSAVRDSDTMPRTEPKRLSTSTPSFVAQLDVIVVPHRGKEFRARAIRNRLRVGVEASSPPSWALKIQG